MKRNIFFMHCILTVKCLLKSNHTYILKDSEDSEILLHDNEDLYLQTNEIWKFFEDYFFVSNNTSRRFQIKKERAFKDREERRALRTFAGRRIVGGKQTSIRMHPYNVAISRHDKHWCGGSLVDEQWVLSAGHCMESAHDGDKKKLSPFVVRAGSSFHNRGGYQARINKVFFPKSYTPGNADYDFSLLRLDRPMPIGRSIAVVNLPAREYRVNPDEMLVVTGWGSTQKSGLGVVSSRMRFVLVPVVEPYKCQESYRFYISPRMLCAGYSGGGKDACNHDSGGPAIHDGVLAGIVSFGGKICGDPRSPGVYARVSEMTDWVNHTIHHNEASQVPELTAKIEKARKKEKEIEIIRTKIIDKNEKIRYWLRELLRSPAFIMKAKRKLRAAE